MSIEKLEFSFKNEQPIVVMVKSNFSHERFQTGVMCEDSRVMTGYKNKGKTFEIRSMVYSSQHGWISENVNGKPLSYSEQRFTKRPNEIRNLQVFYSDSRKFDDKVRYDWRNNSLKYTKYGPGFDYNTYAEDLKSTGEEKSFAFEVKPHDIEYIMTVVVVIRKRMGLFKKPQITKMLHVPCTIKGTFYDSNKVINRSQNLSNNGGKIERRNTVITD